MFVIRGLVFPIFIKRYEQFNPTGMLWVINLCPDYTLASTPARAKGPFVGI